MGVANGTPTYGTYGTNGESVCEGANLSGRNARTSGDAEACVIEGFRCIAIEREAAYLPLIVARLSKPIQPDLFGGAA